MSQNRLNHLYQLMSTAGLDAVALNPGPSLTYLTGLNFHLMERPTVLLLAPPATPVLILPELEHSKAQSSRIAINTITFGDNPALWDTAFTKAAGLLNLSGKKVGVEPNRLRFLEMGFLQTAAPDARLVAADSVFNQLRICKEPEEIEHMRTAARIAENALTSTLALVRPGVTEREIAAELSIQLLRHGSGPELPFSPIVAAGPNSANPHAVPSNRPLQAGDLVLFDWGASYEGYASDITRTFALGEPGEEMRRIYAAVQQANAAGRSVGKPGLRAGAVDDAARGAIDSAGFGAYFTHRTGHGLGMEAHEGPYMFAENELKLAKGMVYTVEPGVYLEGRGGVRIEDDVVVTADGSESLTTLPRDLVIL